MANIIGVGWAILSVVVSKKKKARVTNFIMEMSKIFEYGISNDICTKFYYIRFFVAG